MDDYTPQDQNNQTPQDQAPQETYQPPQETYQQPMYQQQPPAPAAPDNKGKAIAALVIGIVAFVCVWLGWGALLGIVLGIVGIILAVQVRKEGNPETQGLATGGLVCSLIALILSSVTFVACTLCTACAAAAGGIGSLL